MVLLDADGPEDYEEALTAERGRKSGRLGRRAA
jgi:hypothetical protein